MFLFKLPRAAVACLLFLCILPVIASAKGNTTIDSFSKAKKLLLDKVYYDHRVTFYCDCPFKRIKPLYLLLNFLQPRNILNGQKEWNGSMWCRPKALANHSRSGGRVQPFVSAAKENRLRAANVLKKPTWNTGICRPISTT